MDADDQLQTHRSTRNTPLVRYAVTVAAVAAAVLTRRLLDPLLGDDIPYATFFAAVALAAWIGGLRTGLLATGLGGVLAWYFFVPPRNSFLPPSGPHLVGLVMYVVVGLTIAGFGEAVRVARRRDGEETERLRTTLASIGDAVITTDAAGRVTDLNAVAEKLTGWTAAAAAGRPLDAVFVIVNETTRQPVENPAFRALRQGVIVGLANHTVLIARDGTERPIDDSAAPIRRADGEVVGCVLVFRDITDRHEAERSLRASEERYRTLFESMDEGFVVIEVEFDGAGRAVDYRHVEANPAFEKHTGLRGHLGKSVRQTVPGLEEFWFATYGRVAATGEPTRFEHRAGPLEGRWFDVYAARLGGPGGKRVAILFTDITARKRAEADLTAAHQFLHSSIDALPNHIAVLDEHGVILAVNDAWRRFADENQYGGRNYGVGSNYVEECESTSGECVEAGAVAAGLAAVLTGRQAYFELEYPCHSPTEQRWFTMRVTTFKSSGPVRVVVSHEDVTKRRLAEEALKDADRRKDEFLATLAHELRNPLAPVRSGIQIMKLAAGKPDAVERSREMIERQVEQMAHLIDDLMDLSRISRGKITLQKTRMRLAGAVRDAVDASRPLIERQGHEFALAVPDEPIFVDGDHTRLTQVFANLLNNAAKYTDRGGRIRLSVERHGGEVVVAVEDTGVGIPADMLPRVFEMFAQVDRTLEKSQGGLGIGLNIVRRLVEMHDGTIAAKSGGHGQGSVFTVRLPAVPSPAAEPTEVKPTEAVAAARRRILVVDDNADGATSLAEMLAIMGNETRTAHDGLEAVAAAETFRPDVILMDIGMPRLNGFDACRRIREQPWGRSVVMVAQTGWGQDDDKRKAREAGFDRHMTKPVEPAALEKLLAEMSAATG